ncbi:MAG: hypothetical protein KC493_08205 [Bacteriovoracaceae bacterium]|nr:hypothetical protein [Bacteriovoracaceae bacterium]
MPDSLTSIHLYIKERLKLFPWLLMPFVLFFIGHGPAKYQFTLIISLVFAIVFFRALDDYFCFSYDLIKKKSDYLNNGPRPILFLALTSGVIYLLTVNYFYDAKTLLLNIFLIVISCAFYIKSKRNKLITIVSILKYPVLLYAVGSITNESNFLWIILASVFFLAREILEEFFDLKNKKIEIAILIILLNTKLILRYI